ncbi:MAG: glycosyl hydrolase family 18 protein, partial [Syntrophothermaceae bacterium]
GLKTHASVMLFNREQLSVLLNSPGNRKNLITNLKKVVKEHNFDGVNIDFEMIAPEDKDSFTGFLKELKAGLGWDKTVSVAVFARTGKENWPTPYDYKALGQVCDLVVIMAYDYSYNQAGPVAPLDWCGQVVDLCG